MPLMSQRAVDLIVRWEVGGKDLYTRKYSRPIWPGNSASGVTVGVGYDLGHQTASTILEDWAGFAHRGYLAAMAGFTGQEAGNLAARRQFIVVDWPWAYKVFQDPTLIRYQRITERAFGAEMYNLRPETWGALVSLVYNRGGNMIGDGRREMRYIRDVCIPQRNNACVSEQLLAMRRLWRGAKLGKGLIRRREDEARLAMG
jgi:hypothetical protein